MGKIRVGDRLDDRWEVLEEHTGGMGIVYVLGEADGGRLAAKTVRDDLLDQTRVLKRFAVELETWIALGSHPNLVEAQGTFEVEGRPFLLLEYVQGLTLGDLLETDGPLLPAEALDYALGLARGMRHAESSETGAGGRGLVHRDLKPSNVFVTPQRRARVSDFGMVKVFHRDGSITDEGIGLGTPWYLSPEQLRNARTADGRTDVYAAGAMLYEALVGEPPLKADNIENQIYNILRREVPSPAASNPLVSFEVAGIVLRCLAKERGKRFPNFAALVRALAGALRVEARRPVPAGAVICPSCGHVSVSGRERCVLDDSVMETAGSGARYQPVEEPGATMDLLPDARVPLQVRVDGVEIRPRVPRAGLPVRVTALLANPGIRPVPGCVLPFRLPDEESFLLNESGDHWAGEVPPTAAGAPRRVTWSVTPLRDGEFLLPAPLVLFRDENGERREESAEEDVRLQVEPRSILPLVGRDGVMEELKHGVDDALAGRARAHVILGAAGMGKTRTLDEIET
ncbi:MAG: serine/threonine protein kinase, partial [Planctomycetota bacterium]